MKKVIIKKLSLENFKGQTRDFFPNEDVTKVFERNGQDKVVRSVCVVAYGLY